MSSRSRNKELEGSSTANLPSALLTSRLSIRTLAVDIHSFKLRSRVLGRDGCAEISQWRRSGRDRSATSDISWSRCWRRNVIGGGRSGIMARRRLCMIRRSWSGSRRVAGSWRVRRWGAFGSTREDGALLMSTEHGSIERLHNKRKKGSHSLGICIVGNIRRIHHMRHLEVRFKQMKSISNIVHSTRGIHRRRINQSALFLVNHLCKQDTVGKSRLERKREKKKNSEAHYKKKKILCLSNGDVWNRNSSGKCRELGAQCCIVVGSCISLFSGNERPNESEDELGVHVQKVLGLDGDFDACRLGRVEGQRQIGHFVGVVLWGSSEASHLDVQRAAHNVAQSHSVLQIEHQIRDGRLIAPTQVRVGPSKKSLKRKKKK